MEEAKKLKRETGEEEEEEPKQAPKRAKYFTWNEVFTYEEEDEDEEEEQDPQTKRDRLMTDCILQAMMDGRLDFAVSEDIRQRVLGLPKGDGIPTLLSPMMFATYWELYPILRVGLKKSKNASLFDYEFKGEKEKFYLDLTKESKKRPCMTLCFSDER
jgi:hypothetical protein